MCNILKYKTGGKVIRPHTFVGGGQVKAVQRNIPAGMLKPRDPDRVLARLMPGELVIPLKHVGKVKRYLKKEKIRLPGF